MNPTTRRRLRSALTYLIIGPAIFCTVAAVQHIQADPLAPATWLITAIAAALLFGLVRCLDSAHS